MPEAYAGYDVIDATMLGHGFTRYWDDAAKAPYLYSASRHEFVSYEDPESLGLKCVYVRRQGLAGVMFWEYFSDPGGVLLDAIRHSLEPGATSVVRGDTAR